MVVARRRVSSSCEAQCCRRQDLCKDSLGTAAVMGVVVGAWVVTHPPSLLRLRSLMK